MGTGTALGAVVLASAGTIKNGTIADAGSGLTFSGGTLDGVTYQGPLNLSQASSSLYIKDGITLTGAGGSGNGTINLTGTGSYPCGWHRDAGQCHAQHRQRQQHRLRL